MTITSILKIQNQLYPHETLKIPEQCSECGFANFKIYGLMQNKQLSLTIRCMRCGKITQEINHN